MASMRNGCGDDWFILFAASGATGIKGLAHEYPAARDPGLVEQIRKGLPSELSEFASEPAFNWDSTSFCYWRLADDPAWSEVPEQESAETGADKFLGIPTNPLAGYCKFASDYYERDIEQSVIQHVLSHLPVTPDVISSLNAILGSMTYVKIWSRLDILTKTNKEHVRAANRLPRRVPEIES